MTELTIRHGLPVLAWPALAPGVDAIVTTRHGGASTGTYRSLNLALHVGDDPAAVLENRRRVAAAIGHPLGAMVYAHQVHGTTAAVVGPADRGRGAQDQATALPGVDALVTTTPDLPLVIMVADCVPILLVDPAARVLACVHAGWRGTAAGVVQSALATMAALGAQPERVVAAIGPAIDPDRYQVDAVVADALTAALAGDGRAAGQAGVEQVLRPDGTDRWRADLAAASRLALERGGIPPAAIFQCPWASGGTDFFSHREAQAQPTGRFALVATLVGCTADESP